jgi:nicotinate-nucleotide adenylyltransferase
MGGTFDPPHFGHLRTAFEVLQRLALDEIHFIPCGTPNHRETAVASQQQRLDMLECAIESDGKLIIDSREVEREGPSYMIDTLRSLQADYVDADLFLILGMDAFATLSTWHEWQMLSDFAKLVVVRRMPYQLPTDAKFRAWYKALEKQDKIVFMDDLTQFEISATQIRQMLQTKKSPRFLLPEAVLNYIIRNKLYGGN